MGLQGDLHRARLVLSELVAEAKADRDRFWEVNGLAVLGMTLAFMGEPEQARAAGEASIAIADHLGVAFWASPGYACLAAAAMAAGDADVLRDATQLAERIVTTGGPAGVSLVVATRGPDLAYFGGSDVLRYGLARDNCAGLGPDGYDLTTLDRSQPKHSNRSGC